jgi:uracil-DNA glycosylase
LLNSSLTVEKNSPLSHSNKGWEEFVTECLIKLVQLGNPLVGIAFGASARKIMEEVGIWSNKYQKFIYVEHPAKSAYEGRDWDHKGCFQEVNDFLRKETNRIIEW